MTSESTGRGKVSFFFSALHVSCYSYGTCKKQSSEDVQQAVRSVKMDGVHVLSEPVQN